MQLPATSLTPCNMRKRKHGEFYDEETGETTVVQTTKQAKRVHQKHGKWYKEPTEAEIKAWDREDELKKRAEKSERREQNKKINALKRAEKEAKEQQIKQSLFDAGKISFTQTLAKKDEDQRNLHIWFGGKPKQAPVTKQSLHEMQTVEDANDEDKENEPADGEAREQIADDTNLSQQSDGHEQENRSYVGCIDPSLTSQHDSKSLNEALFDARQALRSQMGEATIVTRKVHNSQIDNMHLLEAIADEADLTISQDFEIAEDSDAETDILEDGTTEGQAESQRKDTRNATEYAKPVFKVPALPIKRPPLSPMSQSQLNARAVVTPQVSSFKNRMARADISIPSSTQLVRDILSSICTQDLADDLNDDFDEQSEDKENTTPGPISLEVSPSKSQTHSPRKPSPLKQVEVAHQLDAMNAPLKSDDLDSYDDVFAELDLGVDAGGKVGDLEFDDGALDDTTLLCLPETQLAKSARPGLLQLASVDVNPVVVPPVVTTTTVPPSTAEAYEALIANQIRPQRQALGKSDSFTVDDDEEDVLFDTMVQFERIYKSVKIPTVKPHDKEGRAKRSSQQTSVSPASSGSTNTDPACKRRRTLPWPLPNATQYDGNDSS